ncbi:MAG: hypothetical protein ACT4QE_05155 [Anaerolineales bacterium]
MAAKRDTPAGLGRLEVLLVIAFFALVFQVFPSLWFGLVWAADVRNWARSAWMGVTVAILVVLFGLRFVPDLWADWRERRAESASAFAKREKAERAKAERERVAALRKGRSRRMY